MAKNRNLSPEQTPLFETESFANSPKKRRKIRKAPVVPLEKTWREFYGRPGSYVDVAERARLLITALGSFSSRNSRLYFPFAAAVSPHDKRIAESYGDDLPGWKLGAKINRKRDEERAEKSFKQATGLEAMHGTGLLRPDLIEPLSDVMWDEFEFFYKNKRRNKDRNDYIERLKAFLPEDTAGADVSDEEAA